MQSPAMECSVKRILKSLVTATFALFPAITPAVAATWNLKGASLSVDPQGWAYQSGLAAGSSGLYAIWDQHLNAGNWQMVSPYVAHWNGSVWQTLGGRLAHSAGQDGVLMTNGEPGYTPSIVVIGTATYAAWYEQTNGWGWNPGQGDSSIAGASVFVAHWDGSQWDYDYNASNTINFALNESTPAQTFARDPIMADFGGQPYITWIQFSPGVNGYDSIVIEHLNGGSWIQDAAPLTLSSTRGERIINGALGNMSGVPIVAWSRFFLPVGGTADSSSTVQAAELSGGSWHMLGGALNVASSDHTGFVALTVMNGTPYVAWQEKSATGPYQIYASYWSGSSWINIGGSLNVNATASAGRPALANDGSAVWLAWPEGGLNATSQLYVRSLAAGVWSSPQGPLNVNAAGSADDPAMAVLNGAVQVIWSETDPASNTKQVYVKGVESSAGFPAAVSPFGSNGTPVALPNNTWTALQPGGIAASNSVHDEAFDCFYYDPGIRKALYWGSYHTSNVSNGEDQNALLAYDFPNNRWDLFDVGDAQGNERFANVGHDECSSAVDTTHHLLVTHGEVGPFGGLGTNRQTHVYDLVGHRGSFPLPTTESPWQSNSDGTAYDSDHDLIMQVGGGNAGSYQYSHVNNAWTVVSTAVPAASYFPGLIYDTRNHLFVEYGGGVWGGAPSSATWVYNTMTGGPWLQRTPSVVGSTTAIPALFNPFMAYDSRAGVTLLTGGTLTPMGGSGGNSFNNQVWIYDGGANTWTRLADLPSGAPYSGQGNFLTYDPDDDVFLLRSGTDTANLWAFRYAPGPVDAHPPAKPQGLVLE